MKELLQKAALAAAVVATALGVASAPAQAHESTKDVGAYSHIMFRDTGWPY